MCIKPSNKSKKLVTKVANQGSQLVVFPNTFVGGFQRGNACGNKSVTGCKNYRKKLKTCSKHVTFCKVGPCKEPCLENHVSKTRTHNNSGPCD
jgi:predicted amidohydrolase